MYVNQSLFVLFVYNFQYISDLEYMFTICWFVYPIIFSKYAIPMLTRNIQPIAPIFIHIHFNSILQPHNNECSLLLQVCNNHFTLTNLKKQNVYQFLHTYNLKSKTYI